MVSCLRSPHQTEKGRQPGGESRATSTGETVSQSSAAQGSEEVWSLADTAVELQIHIGENRTPSSSLLFWISRGRVLEVE